MMNIMGQAKATADQMAAYIKKVNPRVPESVIRMIPLYLSEGESEGVRGDIAFAQSCLETGNFTFAGSAVTLDQNNFAGIGVTKNGMKGNSWKTPQLGIRAQIQHLKAYACGQRLNQTCIDPRFTYVKRGSAPYVEWLGIQENPTHAGWAAGAGYGAKIINILNAILGTGEREGSMNINKMITKKRCYVGQNNPSYVVIHETDNWSKGAGAKTHANAMYNGNLDGTVHYYVDSVSVYQTLEHQDGAYAVGDGHGEYGITNRNSINIEICVNPESDYYKAVDKAEQLAAYLLKQYGWDTSRLKRHYDASRKHCPRRILDEGLWPEFVKRAAAYMSGIEVGEITSPVSNCLGNGDTGSEVRKLQEDLIALGYDCGAYGADGSFGDDTETAVKAFQKANNLTVDGLAGENTLAKIKELMKKPGNVESNAIKYYVQAGAFKNKDKAQDLTNRLKKAGFDAIIKDA